MTDGAIEGAFYAEMGKKLTLRRRTVRMSQETLALEIGCHRNTIMRWESGESAMGAWELMRVSSILHCNHFMLIPSEPYVWGSGLKAAMREREGRKPVQAERDPYLTMAEEAHLAGRRTA